MVEGLVSRRIAPTQVKMMEMSIVSLVSIKNQPEHQSGNLVQHKVQPHPAPGTRGLRFVLYPAADWDIHYRSLEIKVMDLKIFLHIFLIWSMHHFTHCTLCSIQHPLYKPRRYRSPERVILHGSRINSLRANQSNLSRV